jgi:hypothetical protein
MNLLAAEQRGIIRNYFHSSQVAVNLPAMPAAGKPAGRVTQNIDNMNFAKL